ncbi:hypothetical protein C8Q74DRAFT_390574 [Fomes fomentarius]|nr:hypothetical protein C8Q74DRAFT_390574 [Fomes fomentarius]
MSGFRPVPHHCPLSGISLTSLSQCRRRNMIGSVRPTIVHLDALGQHIIILGSQDAISEILEKRSAKYSDRPPSAMSDLIDLGWNMVLLNLGGEWRTQRRQYHRFLGPTAVSQYYPLLEKQTQRLLRNLLMHPQDFSGQMRRRHTRRRVPIPDPGRERYLPGNVCSRKISGGKLPHSQAHSSVVSWSQVSPTGDRMEESLRGHSEQAVRGGNGKPAPRTR